MTDQDRPRSAPPNRFEDRPRSAPPNRFEDRSSEDAQSGNRRRRRGAIGHAFEPGEDVILDYKDVDRIRNFLAPSGKIMARRQTGLDAKQQRKLARAIKRARYLALLPYTQRR